MEESKEASLAGVEQVKRREVRSQTQQIARARFHIVFQTNAKASALHFPSDSRANMQVFHYIKMPLAKVFLDQGVNEQVARNIGGAII